MRSAGQIAVFFGLAALLAIGGCPGGGAVYEGVAPGAYIGPLACFTTMQLADGTWLPTQEFDLDMSVNVADDGTLSVNDVTYLPGASRSSTINNTVVLETVADVLHDDGGIYVKGRALVDGVFGRLVGEVILTVTKNSTPGTADVAYGIEAESTDLSLLHYCEGTFPQQ